MEDPDIAPVDISLISVPEDRNPFLHLREAVSSGVPEDEARTMLIDPHFSHSMNICVSILENSLPPGLSQGM